MTTLEHGTMENFGVSFSLFEPLDSGFLPPKSFFLRPSFSHLNVE
jgi:hypothetical protein